eukprot:6191981-Pleurochrysis_carterae.AAC.4
MKSHSGCRRRSPYAEGGAIKNCRCPTASTMSRPMRTAHEHNPAPTRPYARTAASMQGKFTNTPTAPLRPAVWSRPRARISPCMALKSRDGATTVAEAGAYIYTPASSKLSPRMKPSTCGVRKYRAIIGTATKTFAVIKQAGSSAKLKTTLQRHTEARASTPSTVPTTPSSVSWRRQEHRLTAATGEASRKIFHASDCRSPTSDMCKKRTSSACLS